MTGLGGRGASGRRRRRTGVGRAVLAVLALTLLSAANGSSPEVRRQETVPGVWVQISADWDIDYSACLPDDAPEIVVVKPAGKGETLIGLALTQVGDGTCKGTLVDSRVLLYKANEATSGEDRFDYRVKHANGKSDERRVVVKIKEQPH